MHCLTVLTWAVWKGLQRSAEGRDAESQPEPPGRPGPGAARTVTVYRGPARCCLVSLKSSGPGEPGLGPGRCHSGSGHSVRLGVSDWRPSPSPPAKRESAGGRPGPTGCQCIALHARLWLAKLWQSP
jgi:hypothetical protein